VVCDEVASAGDTSGQLNTLGISTIPSGRFRDYRDRSEAFAHAVRAIS